VVFIATADEEHGCAGAVAYCSRHADRLASTVATITLDALGWQREAKRSLVSDRSLRNFALESCLSLGWRPEVEIEASEFPGSDYNAFIDAGVPAAFFWRYPPPHPYYHTAGDIPELIDFEIAAETASVAGHTAVLLADDDQLDLGRSRPTRRWQRTTRGDNLAD
jgi:Zn-dependent M28 family amino/carboxypeptidase